MPERQFVIRKVVMARDAAHAVKKEKAAKIVAVFEDEDQQKQGNERTSAIGFRVSADYEDWD